MPPADNGVPTRGRPAAPGLPTVAEARARARLVSAGGAYLAILDQDFASGGEPDGAPRPLAGLSFAVKDLIAVAGLPLSAGSAARREAPPEAAHAPVVAALLAAGATLIGLTALHEFAFGVTGLNDYTGTPANPRAPGRIPGGSSSGSAAAVAEGSASFALGTDTGGSIRIPAALCGVVGFKPAFDSYPMEGVFPLSPSLDHVGLIAPTVEIIQQVHAVLAPPASGERRPRRIGFLARQLASCAPEVRARMDFALDRLAGAGCQLEAVDEAWPPEEASLSVSTTIMFAEAAAVHADALAHDGRLYGADVRERLRQGLAISAVDYIKARAAQQQLKDQVGALLRQVDCVVGPTVGVVAPRLEEALEPSLGGRLVAFTRLANVTGSPALSLPVPGPGLPVGLQLVAAADERAMKFGAWVARVIGG